MAKSQGRGPDIAPHRKGTPYALGKSSYLTANLYSAWWQAPVGHLHEEQVLALSADSARNKINRRFKVPKSHIGVRLVMRKGAFKSVGLRALK